MVLIGRFITGTSAGFAAAASVVSAKILQCHSVYFNIIHYNITEEAVPGNAMKACRKSGHISSLILNTTLDVNE
jgi:hypothetical protein